MRYDTLDNLITRVTQRLSQVAGTNVQTYSEDRIAEMIQHKFDAIFDEAWWPQFMTWQSSALDGVNGVVALTVTDYFKHFDDIRAVFLSTSATEIPQLSATANPYLYSGTTPLYISPIDATDTTNASKVFRVWPLASTGTLRIHGRTRPDTYTGDDEVKMDDQLLIIGAAYDYLEDDGTNPNATAKMQNMFESRLQQLKNMHSNKPIVLDSRTSVYPTHWITPS